MVADTEENDRHKKQEEGLVSLVYQRDRLFLPDLVRPQRFGRSVPYDLLELGLSLLWTSLFLAKLHLLRLSLAISKVSSSSVLTLDHLPLDGRSVSMGLI